MEILFLVVGGLALFLYGMRLMSDGLQNMAGDKMRTILEKGTKTPIRGVLTGLLVTGLIQSSSGTSVIAVGLVNAKLLTLKQAIGVILGANIGTTVTAYLIGFKLTDFALPIIFAGAMLFLFVKNRQISFIGQTLLGFGMLFYGMDVMGGGLKPLGYSDFFMNLMASVDDNSLVGVAIGLAMTAVIQSSSATIGVLQELCYQGVVTYEQAVPILFGDNIGTTVTAIIAGFGASIEAKRTSLVNLFCKTIGTLIFLPLYLCGVLPFIVEGVSDIMFAAVGGWEAINVKMQIAQTHGVFNILNTALHLPFVGLLAALVTKLIPDKVEEVEEGNRLGKPIHLESRLLNNPPMALSNAMHELLRMNDFAMQTLNYARLYLFEHKTEDKENAYLIGQAVDDLDVKITDYVVEATFNKDIGHALSHKSYVILQSVGDLERIGDHAQTLVKRSRKIFEENIVISPEAQKEIAISLKERGMSETEIADILKMSVEEVKLMLK